MIKTLMIRIRKFLRQRQMYLLLGGLRARCGAIHQRSTLSLGTFTVASLILSVGCDSRAWCHIGSVKFRHLWSSWDFIDVKKDAVGAVCSYKFVLIPSRWAFKKKLAEKSLHHLYPEWGYPAGNKFPSTVGSMRVSVPEGKATVSCLQIRH
jgi:hypothetical protein